MFKKILFTLSILFQWLPRALRFSLLSKNNETIHVLFCMTDHYEPGSGGVSDGEARDRVDQLLIEYPKLADKHQDSAGNKPTRSWFIPPHYHVNSYLKDVVGLCEKGYGEIELHLHHGKHCPDTSSNLKETIELCVAEYSEFGIFGSENGVRKYGFIHGDWALDNSRGGAFCGVNDEISILKESGCYADYTFPSPNEASPSQINSIFYATDNPIEPKSHDRGVLVEKGTAPTGDLMIIQGPLYPYLKNGKPWGLRVSGDEINGQSVVTEDRIDACIKTGISVKGKDNWVVVKMHTHGATDAKGVLGKEMDDIFTHLEASYNDGKNYKLHYVTARELYNIIKSVEANEECSDPELYRNYKISAPDYNSSPEITEASSRLKELVSRTYKG
jgi:hypothetical protein